LLKKRGISKKSKFVAPSDLLKSDKLYGVWYIKKQTFWGSWKK
jgi:hypothetical protein